MTQTLPPVSTGGHSSLPGGLTTSVVAAIARRSLVCTEAARGPADARLRAYSVRLRVRNQHLIQNFRRRVSMLHVPRDSNGRRTQHAVPDQGELLRRQRKGIPETARYGPVEQCVLVHEVSNETAGGRVAVRNGPSEPRSGRHSRRLPDGSLHTTTMNNFVYFHRYSRKVID